MCMAVRVFVVGDIVLCEFSLEPAGQHAQNRRLPHVCARDQRFLSDSLWRLRAAAQRPRQAMGSVPHEWGKRHFPRVFDPML